MTVARTTALLPPGNQDFQPVPAKEADPYGIFAPLMDKAPGIFHEGSVLYARRARRLASLAIEAKIHFTYKLRRQGKFLFAHGADEPDPAPGGRLLSEGECIGRTNREAHSAMNAIVDD